MSGRGSGTGCLDTVLMDEWLAELVKVLGRKYIRLYHASISEDLYPHMEIILRNTSQVRGLCQITSSGLNRTIFDINDIHILEQYMSQYN